MPNYSLLLSDKEATGSSYKLSVEQLYTMLRKRVTKLVNALNLMLNYEAGRWFLLRSSFLPYGEKEREEKWEDEEEEKEEVRGIRESEDLREIALVNFELSH
ncbi:hypothetical protein HZH68_007193 [Vespula germanica]|uniref:Uncharacterized protein n=1 Tax=Vespula germanica TaxID=30212 RepID=A0A834NBI3_VESGE|nr:hypothetical protein HZH68_007193 [Vespula germanica]